MKSLCQVTLTTEKKYPLIPNQCAHSGMSLTPVLAVTNVTVFHLLEIDT